jgi:SOS-response transcriptional repressor LexA
VRDWLAARGVRVRLCHGSAGSDDRTTALLDLERGDIDAICSVDLFNEGIDCRPVDRVVMLRPTESPVLFLQQLGRGLRRAAGKGWLQVIDMVGNHKVFLDRVRTLLQIGGGETSVASFLERGEAVWPPGCSVEIELEAVDLLRRLLPAGGGVAPLVAAYRELVQVRGERPTAGEMVRRGFSLRSLVQVRGGWFGFVGEEGDLLADEAAAVRVAGPWLLMLQTLPLRSCLRMVLLEVLVEGDGLRRGLPLAELARSAWDMVERSPELREEVGEDEFSEVWQTRAVDPWLATPWFRREGERLQARFAVDDALVALTRELVDARLAMWRRDRPVGGERFDLRVGRHHGDLCLVWSPVEKRRLTGDLDVRLGDGSSWRFRFAAEGVRVAHVVGRDRNGLPALLRDWFGPAPEVGRSVRFRASPDGWWVEPLGMEAVEQGERVPVCAFPSLVAAAGWLTASVREPDAAVVRLPGPVGDTSFAVRVSGSSMEGGPNPLREGDWAIFEPVHDAGLGALEGRVALVDLGDADAGMELHIKRIVRDGAGYRLRSDNPEVAERPAEAAVARARLVRSVRPEALAPAEGSEIGDLQAAFGLSAMPEGEAVRVDGHLFLLASGVDVLKAPDRWARRVVDRGPGETAYVCARPGPDRPWHYLGVGRWSEQAWSFPAPSLPVWRTLSTSRSSSRTLPPRWRSAAEALASRLEASHLQAPVTRGTQQAEILGRVPQGGLRIGGADRATRTVSLTDLGWVLAAEAEVRGSGSALDETQVNRLRYLDGTPKEATRWIDTGWALGLLALMRSA